MEEKKHIHIKPLVAMIVCAIVLIFTGSIAKAELADWIEVSEGIFNNPEDGSVVVRTEDKTKVSDYYYQTQGFTITDSQTGQSIRIALNNPNNVTTTYQSNGRHVTEWKISYETIMNTVAEQYPDWAQRIANNTAADLQFDAIINVCKNGEWAGKIDYNTGETSLGTLYDKDNWEQLIIDFPELAFLEGDIANHYEKLLTLLKGEWVLENGKWVFKLKLVTPTPPTSSPSPSFDPSAGNDPEYVKRIGKQDPDFYTYNYDPTGKFVIGANYKNGSQTGGIPSSEDLTNGYEANEWYGEAQIHRRISADHSWTFTGDVSITVHTGQYYQVPYDDEDPSKGYYDVEYTYTTSRKGTGTVDRSVRYWYLGAGPNGTSGVWIFNLDTTVTENTVFPGGKHTYKNYDPFSVTCTHNGNDLTSMEYEYDDYLPDDDYHVDWNRAVKYGAAETYVISGATASCSIGGESAAANSAVAAAAQSHIEPNSEIWVRNDELTVEGHTYMSSAYYQFKDFHETFGEENTASDIPESDYGLVADEETAAIPPETANGDYKTYIATTYKRVVCLSDFTKTFGPTSTRIKNGYDPFGHHFIRDNEAVRVHTPTVSPVEVINPDTGSKYELSDMQTQLVSSAVNERADYQFLLDGTYTIQFTPETHFEHIGYDDPELVASLYEKYCSFREVCFPFTVQVNGRIYEPTEESVGIYKDVDFDCGRKKLPGYTDWIRLPDGAQEVEFYIPTWAIEDSDYVVQFRVAPINVVDHKKVDHIEDYTAWDYDWEYLKNESITIPGHGSSDLYEYVSTYSFTCQVSGIIYDFQAVGINDKDRFEGYKIQSNGYAVSNGLGIANYYAFCPDYSEKRSGIRNRFGNVAVRYSFDGSLTNDWNEANTLPFARGRANSADGELRRGNTFAFTVKTIANLGDEDALMDNSTTGDCIIIKPSFRYISPDGTVNRDIDVYYHTGSPDGKEEYLFVQYGEARDLECKEEVRISDLRFNGSYYYNSGQYEQDKRQVIDKDMMNMLSESYSVKNESLWKYHHDDAEYSKDSANAYQKLIANLEGRTGFPDEAYSTTSVFLNRKTNSYCLSEIVLNSRLRLLTGNVEQLKMNENNEGDSLQYLDDRLSNGTAYKITPQTCEAYGLDYWEKHRKSMQTWFGTYWIPNQLFVTDDVFEVDTDGDGVKEKYDNLWDYTNAKGYIEENDPIFKNTGYLVVNFEIYTKNDGQDHLSYIGSNADMWKIEGQPDTVEAGDPNIPGDTVEIEVDSGDVAVIDLRRSIADGWTTGYNIIN